MSTFITTAGRTQNPCVPGSNLGRNAVFVGVLSGFRWRCHRPEDHSTNCNFYENLTSESNGWVGICLTVISGGTACCLGLVYFSRLILHTVGMAPGLGDQSNERPLSKHRTTQTQNKRAHTRTQHAASGIRTDDVSEDSAWLRLRGHCELQEYGCLLSSNYCLLPGDAV